RRPPADPSQLVEAAVERDVPGDQSVRAARRPADQRLLEPGERLLLLLGDELHRAFLLRDRPPGHRVLELGAGIDAIAATDSAAADRRAELEKRVRLFERVRESFLVRHRSPPSISTISRRRRAVLRVAIVKRSLRSQSATPRSEEST